MKQTKSEEEIKAQKEAKKQEAKRLKEEKIKEFQEATKRRSQKEKEAELASLKLGKRKRLVLKSILFNVRWSIPYSYICYSNALYESSNPSK